MYGFEPADPAIRFERDPIEIDATMRLDENSLDELRRSGITHVILREWEFSEFLANSLAGLESTDRADDSSIQEAKVVWRTPDRFKRKNRWLRVDLVVLQL